MSAPDKAAARRDGYEGMTEAQAAAWDSGFLFVHDTVDRYSSAELAGHPVPSPARIAMDIHLAIGREGEELKPFVAQGVLEALVRMSLTGQKIAKSMRIVPTEHVGGVQ